MLLRCGITRDTKDKLEQQSDKKVLKRMQTELNFMKDIIKRKMKYAEHVLRGSSGLSHPGLDLTGGLGVEPS